MTCFEIQEYLLDYVDNELPASLQQVVTEHLQACLSCREEVESYRKTAVLLQLRAVPEPPLAYWDSSWESIRSRLRARVLPLYGKRLVSPSRWLWLKRFSSRRVAAAAAIFFFLALAVWWMWQSRQREFAEATPRSMRFSEFTRQAPSRPNLMDERRPPRVFVPIAEEALSEDVRRQMELIAVSRVAFGSIDPISKSAMLAKMEVETR
jgi:hypothetical protein